MNKQWQIKIIIPLMPLKNHEENLREYIDASILELLGLSNKIEINLFNSKMNKVSISFLENYTSKASQSKRVSNALVFDTYVEVSSNLIEIANKNEYIITESDRNLLLESIIADEFSDKIYEFLILSQIAKPGSLKLREGDIYANEGFENFFYPFISLHRLSLNEIKKFKWPIYENIKYIDAWNWFQRNNFSLQRVSNSKTETAINAFTYLFKDYLGDYEFDLFWSLIGIEALYCSGKEGLAEQIRIKSQIVLGEITDYKKRLNNMYEFRSRLVHGDLNIPPKHHSYDVAEQDKFYEGLFDSAILSVSILTATLQKMIINNKGNFEFKYTIL